MDERCTGTARRPASRRSGAGRGAGGADGRIISESSRSIRVIKQIGTNFGSGTNLAPLKFVPVQTGTNFWDKFSIGFSL